jgi:hypothetical protein
MARDPKKPSWDEFECPECSADNIVGNGFTIGDEVFCNWCGQVFLVRKTDDDDRFKLVLN